MPPKQKALYLAGKASEAPANVFILPDGPACMGDGCSPDAFALDRKLGRQRDALRARSTQTPLAIALTGDWGTGKSTAMNWLRGELVANHDGDTVGYKTCLFKP